jgi:DNA-binding transcriptional LysR family regulator
MNILDLDLNLVHVMLALDSERSVSRAAIALGKQQPTISSALAQLRKTFDDPLFVYTANRMEPTPRAKEIVRFSLAIKRIAVELISAPSFDATQCDQSVRLALSDVGEMVWLPVILRALRVEMPMASLCSVSPPAMEVSRQLENGALDLAVGFFPDLQKRNFYQQTVYSEGFAGLIRADHPVVSRTLTLDQFRKLEHAVVRVESRTEEVIERFLSRHRIRRKVVLTTPHFMSAPFVIAQSNLFVTVPRPLAIYFARTTDNLRMVELPFHAPRIALKQYWHRSAHHDARSRWLRGLIYKLFQSSAAAR